MFVAECPDVNDVSQCGWIWEVWEILGGAMRAWEELVRVSEGRDNSHTHDRFGSVD